MGTYTTNYNLFMPTVGETGWGELVNGNFALIDTTMKGFDDVLSKMTWNGNNVTFPGNVTTNGTINANDITLTITATVTSSGTNAEFYDNYNRVVLPYMPFTQYTGTVYAGTNAYNKTVTVYFVYADGTKTSSSTKGVGPHTFTIPNGTVMVYATGCNKFTIPIITFS